MNEPRYTREDKRRFRLPYVKASASQEPGYLAERMKHYAAMVAAEHKDIVPIKGRRK